MTLLRRLWLYLFPPVVETPRERLVREIKDEQDVDEACDRNW